MPIATHPDYPKNHWNDVLNIIIESIEGTEFEPRLVSDDVAVGLIHDRIVTNIYNDEIVICDVSSKNPNVMFELGLRLAFDKPTIIIKDEKTGYSFDTGVIEHIEYPSSLRFHEIMDFKKKLSERVTATYKKSSSDKNFSPFLGTFGRKIIPSKIQETEIPESQYILDQLDFIAVELKKIKAQTMSLSENRAEGYSKSKHRYKPIERQTYVGDLEALKLLKEKMEMKEKTESDNNSKKASNSR